jgi:hypothetical protein
MQDYPETAKFLNESDRREVKRRLEEDRDSLADEYDRKYVWQAALDWVRRTPGLLVKRYWLILCVPENLCFLDHGHWLGFAGLFNLALHANNCEELELHQYYSPVDDSTTICCCMLSLHNR